MERALAPCNASQISGYTLSIVVPVLVRSTSTIRTRKSFKWYLDITEERLFNVFVSSNIFKYSLVPVTGLVVRVRCTVLLSAYTIISYRFGCTSEVYCPSLCLYYHYQCHDHDYVRQKL